MSDSGFKTSKEAARQFEAQADREIERIKRGLESYVASHGLKPKDAVGRYCSAIGLDVRFSQGAGLEFGPVDTLATAHAINASPMPDVLRRYMSFT